MVTTSHGHASHDTVQVRPGTAQPLQGGQRLTLKPEELVPLLGIGRNGIYSLLRTGEIRSLKIGRKILVPVTAVDEFLAGRSA